MKDDPKRDAAVEMVRRLRQAGHESLFAGGCVRDALRGVRPKDYDIATSAPPREVLRLFPRAGTVGAHFGVVLARHRGHDFEIATFREEGEYRDGRHPGRVRFSNAENDARRRDFTINGMFFDPLEDRLVDFVGGREDLRGRVIRAIGDPAERFGEDYLRLLRAIRFATLLEFDIEARTWVAIAEAAPRLPTISAERIREELDRIWKSEHRLRGFDLLVASGLMEAVLPEITGLRGCQQPPEYHPEGDVFVHTRLMLSHLPAEASLPLVLSVLFHDIAKPRTASVDPATGRIRFLEHERVGAEMTGEILRRLRYPNDVIGATVSAVARHMQFRDVTRMRTSTLKRFMAGENFPEELELHRVDCLASHGRLGNHTFLLEKLTEFGTNDPEPKPLLPNWFVNGGDLLARGWAPGPELGEVLTQAHDLQLEGALNSREEALAWLEERLPLP